MYELKKKKIGKAFTSKFVGTGPSSYEKRNYLAAVSQRLSYTDVDDCLVCRAALHTSHLYKVTNTRCRIGTVFSPDDGYIVARNM